MQPVMPSISVGLRALSAASVPGPPEHPLLGLLAHGAGVEQDQVGAPRDRRCARSPRPLQHAQHQSRCRPRSSGSRRSRRRPAAAPDAAPDARPPALPSGEAPERRSWTRPGSVDIAKGRYIPRPDAPVTERSGPGVGQVDQRRPGGHRHPQLRAAHLGRDGPVAVGGGRLAMARVQPLACPSGQSTSRRRSASPRLTRQAAALPRPSRRVMTRVRWSSSTETPGQVPPAAGQRRHPAAAGRSAAGRTPASRRWPGHPASQPSLDRWKLSSLWGSGKSSSGGRPSKNARNSLRRPSRTRWHRWGSPWLVK